MGHLTITSTKHPEPHAKCSKRSLRRGPLEACEAPVGGPDTRNSLTGLTVCAAPMELGIGVSVPARALGEITDAA